MIGYHQTPDTCGVSASCLMLAGSKPCLMNANIPTTLLLQQCVNTASCRVSGRVLDPWGHQCVKGIEKRQIFSASYSFSISNLKAFCKRYFKFGQRPKYQKNSLSQQVHRCRNLDFGRVTYTYPIQGGWHLHSKF